MRKICFVLLFSVLIGNSVYADDWYGKSGDTCLLFRNGKARDRTFWFCGVAQGECYGYDFKSNKHNAWYYTYGQNVAWGDSNLWCCANSFSEVGTFYMNDEFYISSEKLTKQLSDGTLCTYERKTDVCGGTKDFDCMETEEIICFDNNQEYHNKKCVNPCPKGQAWENENSDKCVDIPKDNSAGVNEETGNIIECESDELFIKSKNECMKKSAMIQISEDVMQKCWRCDGSMNFKICVNYFKNKDVYTADFPDGNVKIDGKYVKFPESCKSKKL